MQVAVVSSQPKMSPARPSSTGDHCLWCGLGELARRAPGRPRFEGAPLRLNLVWSTGSVMVKSPLNRELVATYEVTLSVIDNASDLPERSVSVPNGKAPPGHLLWVTRSRSGQGKQAANRHRPGPRVGTIRPGCGSCEESGYAKSVKGGSYREVEGRGPRVPVVRAQQWGTQKPRVVCDLEP